MQLKTGRFKYFGCVSEACKNTRKLLRSGEPPPKMDPVPMPELSCQKVDIITSSGTAEGVLAASGFQKPRRAAPT